MSESVIVTGIGSGIGFATAKMLLDHGYRVLGLDRSRGRFDDLPPGARSFVEADTRDHRTSRSLQRRGAPSPHCGSCLLCRHHPAQTLSGA